MAHMHKKKQTNKYANNKYKKQNNTKQAMHPSQQLVVTKAPYTMGKQDQMRI